MTDRVPETEGLRGDVSVLVADDHDLVRAGIRTLLESLDEVVVSAETGDGLEALSLIREHRPRLALLDIAMPGLNGLDVAELVRRDCPDTQVIILTMHDSGSHVSAALRAGVVGYVLKEAAVSELPLALEAAARGETWFSPRIADQVAAVRKAPDEGPQEPLGELTERQLQILKLMAEGCSSKDIASILEISSKTVDVHRARLMKRLDIHDVAGLVRLAIRSGLVDADS